MLKPSTKRRSNEGCALLQKTCKGMGREIEIEREREGEEERDRVSDRGRGRERGIK